MHRKLLTILNDDTDTQRGCLCSPSERLTFRSSRLLADRGRIRRQVSHKGAVEPMSLVSARSLILLLLSAVAVHAQTITGSIFGYVTDASGADLR